MRRITSYKDSYAKVGTGGGGHITFIFYKNLNYAKKWVGAKIGRKKAFHEYTVKLFEFCKCRAALGASLLQRFSFRHHVLFLFFKKSLSNAHFTLNEI